MGWKRLTDNQDDVTYEVKGWKRNPRRRRERKMLTRALMLEGILWMRFEMR